MKKKFLLAAVLVGALSLGSCVDNNESASVTAVRNAKAEQLSGLAKLNEAQAEAALITANAQAAYNNALAAFKNAETETEKAKAMEAMARAQAEVARIAAQSEIDLLNLKAHAIEAQAAYEKALLNQGNANVAELQTLFGKYQEAAQDLIDAQIALNGYKTALAKMEAQIINASELTAAQIASFNSQITQLQQSIAADSTKIEVYKKYTNTAEAQAAYNTAFAKNQELRQAWVKADQTSDAADVTETKAGNTMTGSAYADDVRFKMLGKYFAGINIPSYTISETVNGRPSAADGNYCAVVTYNGKTTYIPLFKANEATTEVIKYSPVEGQATQTVPYTVQESYYDLIPGGLAVYMDSINAYVDRTYAAPLAAAEKTLATAQKALADAEKKLADAGKDATQDLKDAVTAAKAAADVALTNKNQAEDALLDMNEEVAEVAELIKSIEANADANTANVKAYNEATLAAANAQVAENQAYAVWNDNNSELQALQDILNDSQAVDQNILNCQTRIANNKQQIANLQGKIAEAENDTSNDDAIARQKQLIADKEAEIVVLQKVVDTTKATLEAAINAGSEE